MLSDFNPDGRHIKHLSRFMPATWHVIQRRLALHTLAYPMYLHMVGLLHRLQRVSGMPRLAARLLPAALALTVRLGLFRSVTGRWLVAVVAVLGSLVFQCPYPGFQALDHLLLLPENGEQSTCKLLYQSDNAFFALNVRSVYLFAGRQRESDHADIVPGLYDFRKLKSCIVWLSSYFDKIKQALPQFP
jgi:hypothetical protein